MRYIATERVLELVDQMNYLLSLRQYISLGPTSSINDKKKYD